MKYILRQISIPTAEKMLREWPVRWLEEAIKGAETNAANTARRLAATDAKAQPDLFAALVDDLCWFVAQGCDYRVILAAKLDTQTAKKVAA